VTDASIIPCVLRTLRGIGNTLSFGGRARLPQSVLRRLFRMLKLDVMVPDFDGTLHMRLRLSEHMQRRIFWMGYYSLDIVALLKVVLRPGMVVIDVGANIGEITLVAAQRVGGAGKVIAFEPVNAIADRLAEHVRLNDLSQVLIQRTALGDSAQAAVPIYTSCGQKASDENQGLASLYGGGEDCEPMEYVDITTLDDIATALALTRVDVIKIDVEGGGAGSSEGGGACSASFPAHADRRGTSILRSASWLGCGGPLQASPGVCL